MNFPYFQIRWADDADSRTVENFQTLEAAKMRPEHTGISLAANYCWPSIRMTVPKYGRTSQTAAFGGERESRTPST